MQPFKYKPKVNSGDLRKRVEIWGNIRFENELGETSYRFTKIGTMWASIVPQTGSLQRQQAETILTNVTHKIIVRYSAAKKVVGDDLNELKNMHIVFNARRFEIKYPLNPYERNETLEIFCAEVLE